MIRVYVHGSCSPNPGKGAYGFIIYSEGEEIERQNGIVSKYTTTNVAEYNAIIEALEIAKELGFESVRVLSSSKLIINHLNCINKVGTSQLKTLYNKVIKLTEEFNIVIFQYIEKEENEAVNLTRPLLNTEPTSRRGRAKELVKNAFIKTEKGYIYLKDDGYYKIDLERLTCTCYDNRFRKNICKHILAAEAIDKRILSI